MTGAAFKKMFVARFGDVPSPANCDGSLRLWVRRFEALEWVFERLATARDTLTGPIPAKMAKDLAKLNAQLEEAEREIAFMKMGTKPHQLYEQQKVRCECGKWFPAHLQHIHCSMACHKRFKYITCREIDKAVTRYILKGGKVNT